MTFRTDSDISIKIKNGFVIKGRIIDTTNDILTINIYDNYNWHIPTEDLYDKQIEYINGEYREYYKNLYEK